MIPPNCKQAQNLQLYNVYHRPRWFLWITNCDRKIEVSGISARTALHNYPPYMYINQNMSNVAFVRVRSIALVYQKYDVEAIKNSFMSLQRSMVDPDAILSSFENSNLA